MGKGLVYILFIVGFLVFLTPNEFILETLGFNIPNWLIMIIGFLIALLGVYHATKIRKF